MNKQLIDIKKEYEDIKKQLGSPGVVFDAKKMAELGKRQAELFDIIKVMSDLEKVEKEMKDNAKINNTEKDAELKQMAMDENIKLSEKKSRLEKELEKSLIPKDPNDGKNIIVEIRAGAGGDESALFAAELFWMVYRFPERNDWKGFLM